MCTPTLCLALTACAASAPAEEPLSGKRIDIMYQRAPASVVIAYVSAMYGRAWDLTGEPKLDLGMHHSVPVEATVPLVIAALDTAGCTTRSSEAGWSTTCPAQEWAGCFVWQRGEGDEPGVIAGIQHHKLPGVDGFARCTSDPERLVFIDR